MIWIEWLYHISNLQMFRLQLPVSKRQKGHSWNHQVTLQCADQIIRLHLQLQQFSRHLFDSDPDDPTLHGACNGEPRVRRQWVVKWEGYGGSRLISISDYCNYCILYKYTIVSYCITVTMQEGCAPRAVHHPTSALRSCTAEPPLKSVGQCWSYFFYHLSLFFGHIVTIVTIVVTFFSCDFELNLLSSRDTAVVAVVWLICPVQI